MSRRRREDEDEEPSELARLTETVTKLQGEIAGLREERRALKNVDRLDAETRRLREEIETLTIERDRQQESHEREKREVEHMVGLEKNRQTVEIDQAKREATLAVREEALTAAHSRFDDQVKFIEARFGEQVEYLQDLMAKVLDRLPTVSVDRTIEESRRPASRPRAKAS